LLFQPEGGVVWASRSLDAFRELAQSFGVEDRTNVRVTRMASDGDGVVAATDGETYRAEVAVIAVGGWAKGLLSPLGLDVPIGVTREQVAFYPLAGESPVLPFLWHSGHAGSSFDVYGLPDGPRTVKVGHHQAGPPVEPGTPGEPDPERTATISRFVDEHLPCVIPHALNSETCLYATTADDDFIIDRVGRIVLAVGLGGHGFKFAPAVGDLVAGLVEGRELPPYASRFALDRF
jgi:sarcosine oxidase